MVGNIIAEILNDFPELELGTSLFIERAPKEKETVLVRTISNTYRDMDQSAGEYARATVQILCQDYPMSSGIMLSHAILNGIKSIHGQYDDCYIYSVIPESGPMVIDDDLSSIVQVIYRITD